MRGSSRVNLVKRGLFIQHILYNLGRDNNNNKILKGFSYIKNHFLKIQIAYINIYFYYPF